MSSKVIVGRYELLEKIGDGGMAVVYKAKDRLLNRAVAVKILKPEFLNDEKFINNFRKESHAAASLSHPNIVSIYDVGKEGNINYIVMELVDGKPLSRIIRDDAPLDYRIVVNYTKQIAAGLSAAHKHGIIHRDVKPHNIIVNSDGIAKIADFGIAKAISTTTIVDGTNETIMGSVHYFSPEQARGGYVDEKSDIYSLGIVMYEMLTGDVPFDGDNPVSVALMHISNPIEPPSRRVDGIPPGLERIVMRATEKFPGDRFKSAEEMIKALDDMDIVRRNVGDSVFTAQPSPRREQTQPIYEYDYERSRKAGKSEPQYYDKSPKKKKKWLPVALLALLLLGGLAFAGMKLGLIGKADIKVPDFRGKTMEEAQQLAEKNNISVEVDKFDTSDEYKAGEVMDQDPPSGEMVKKHTTVKLVVSKGSKNGLVPNVVGMKEDDATKLLEDLGYKVKLKEKKSDKEEGTVLRQNPSAGEQLENGETVTLTISDGKGKGEAKVPSLIGKTEAEAKRILKEAGFTVGNITEVESDEYDKGKVVEQQYEAGTKLEKEKPVGFSVSKGNKNGSKIKLYVDFTQADNEVFYMTITVSDSRGTRNIYSKAQKRRSDEGETVTIRGKGRGKVTVIFDNKIILRKSVDFGTGEMF